jgi:hypothetical protein
MTEEMLAKSRATAAELGLEQVEYREGLAEARPVPDGRADVVIAEARRELRPEGWLQFADVANGRPVPVAAMRDIDLWTG